MLFYFTLLEVCMYTTVAIRIVVGSKVLSHCELGKPAKLDKAKHVDLISFYKKYLLSFKRLLLNLFL